MKNKKQQLVSRYILTRCLAVLACVVSISFVCATPMQNNGSILHDDFNGTTLDASKWETVTYSSSPAISDGEITLDSFSGSFVCAIRTKSGVLDFNRAPDYWVAEIRYKITAIDTPKAWRIGMIMKPEAASNGEAIALDLRMKEGYDTTYTWIYWRGYDNTDLSRNGTWISSPLMNQYYTVTVEVDNVVEEVKIYRDDVLIATKDLLIGTGDNAGMIYPEKLLVGSPSGDEKVNMIIDYITIGVPNKGTLVVIQ